jgi:hypothetical protein
MKLSWIKLSLVVSGLILISSCASNKRSMASTMKMGDSKFCHVNANGYSQCNYDSLSHCKKAVKFLKGTCQKN